MTEVNPDRIISMAAGFQYSKILMAATEHGIFAYVGEGSKTVDDIVKGLKLDREATGMLMGALVGLGFVTQKAGRFKNAPDVKKYLAREGESDSLACIVRHMNHNYQTWENLDDIVKKGRPKKRPSSRLLQNKKYNRDFICGMFEIGYGTAVALAEVIDLKGVHKMADIGGGPAQYPIVFSRKNPETRFVVADYPNTVKVAREYIKKYGLTDRIKAVVSEFFDVKELGIGNDYDLVLLSQVLHAESDRKCIELIGKCHKVLRPGGRIIINENALNKDRMSPPPPLIFAINMLVNTDGRTFTAEELTGWLKAAGFKGIKSRRLHERTVVVEGVK